MIWIILLLCAATYLFGGRVRGCTARGARSRLSPPPAQVLDFALTALAQWCCSAYCGAAPRPVSGN